MMQKFLQPAFICYRSPGAALRINLASLQQPRPRLLSYKPKNEFSGRFAGTDTGTALCKAPCLKHGISRHFLAEYGTA